MGKLFKLLFRKQYNRLVSLEKVVNESVMVITAPNDMG